MRADGSVAEDSQLSDGGRGLNLKRRGTVNFMKNVMYTKIQRAQQSGFVDGSSLDGQTPFDGTRFDHRSRVNNMSMVPGGA